MWSPQLYHSITGGQASADSIGTSIGRAAFIMGEGRDEGCRFRGGQAQGLVKGIECPLVVCTTTRGFRIRKASKPNAIIESGINHLAT